MHNTETLDLSFSLASSHTRSSASLHGIQSSHTIRRKPMRFCLQVIISFLNLLLCVTAATITMALEKDNKNGKSGSSATNPLHLHSSDTPGTSLVSNLLNGNNYLTWNRSMKVALGAKAKLGFINGKCKKPDEESETYEDWFRADCMVKAWIFSSMDKNMVDNFLYCSTSRQLWKELETLFGQSSGPLLYQIQREISSVSQGNLSLSQYYAKLKKLWDEFHCLLPLPECTCGASKQMNSVWSDLHLMQFLMGLNQGYDALRNQLLVMKPRPDVEACYSMLLAVEKGNDVQHAFSENNDGNAMLVNQGRYKTVDSNPNRRTGGTGQRFTKKVDKTDMICPECGWKGHGADTCFKIHGTPEWYLKLQEQKKGFKRNTANTVETTKEGAKKTESGSKGEVSTNMQEIIQQEVMKILKERSTWKLTATLCVINLRQALLLPTTFLPQLSWQISSPRFYLLSSLPSYCPS